MNTATLADFNPALAKELGLPLATDNLAQHGASSVLADEIGSEEPTQAEIDESNQEPVYPAPAFKINPNKVDPEALHVFEQLALVAVEEKITGPEAVRRVMANFPNISRSVIKHTAAMAGINPLSARNTFDKITKVVA